jgi:SAM-dependent methyltransferase
MIDSQHRGLFESLGSLKLDEMGIWVFNGPMSLSYPVEGNARCFQLEDRSFWFAHRNEAILAAMRRYLPVGRHVLDLGGGNGYVTRRMLDEGYDAVLMEPGPAGALNGKTQRLIPDVICATLEQCGFSAESFDAVTLFDVVEHVQDDCGFLEQVSNVLTMDGLVFITVPAHMWMWSASDDSAEHYRRYTHTSIQKALGQRFRLEYFTYFFGVLVLPTLLLRCLPYRARRGKNAGAPVLREDDEHGTRGGLAVRALQALLRPEVELIRRGWSLPVGGSILCVARKV